MTRRAKENLKLSYDGPGKDKSAYVSSLRKRLDFAYNTAGKEARRHGHRYKKIYDMMVRDSSLCQGTEFWDSIWD